MREWIEVRVYSDTLRQRLPPELVKSLPYDVWSISLPRDSPRWGEIRAILDTEPSRYFAWVRRRYTPEELAEAELLRLEITRAFEPIGEECGTKYDRSAACPHCGAGRKQVSDLHLQLRRVYQGWPSIPQARRTGIARTIAEEIVVSRDLADVITTEGVTGCELRPVRGCGENAKITPLWKQLWITGRAGRTVAPTEFGIHAFDPDPAGEYRCPLGHVSGLNLISEVYIERSQWDGSDIAATENLTTGTMNRLPMILISPRFYRLLDEHKFKGFKVEVAHLV